MLAITTPIDTDTSSLTRNKLVGTTYLFTGVHLLQPSMSVSDQICYKPEELLTDTPTAFWWIYIVTWFRESISRKNEKKSGYSVLPQ